MQNPDTDSASGLAETIGVAVVAGALPGRVRFQINPPMVIRTTVPSSTKAQLGMVLLVVGLAPAATGIPDGSSLACIPIICSRDSEGSGLVLV